MRITNAIVLFYGALPDGRCSSEGLLPNFSTEALDELARLQLREGRVDGPADGPRGIRDMRDLLWAAIDDDDSRDLDQLTVAEAMSAGKVKILVAIANVDSFFKIALFTDCVTLA